MAEKGIDTMTPSEFKEFVEKKAEESKLRSRMECLHQCDALIDAGWKFVIPERLDLEPWQWYWRRPAKGKRKNGKLFLSTNQAYNALQKVKNS